MVLNPYQLHWSGSGGTSPLPPQYCAPPLGKITSAWRCQAPSRAGRPSTPSPGQKAGIRYQNKVIGKLSLEGLVPAPWFCYVDSGLSPRWCQPDFLIENSHNVGVRKLIIGEIKRAFHPDAWWQLERIYRPVLACAFPEAELISLCICRSFDPAIPLPVPANLIGRLCEANVREFNVLVWKDRDGPI
jgi:hypothetical protein